MAIILNAVHIKLILKTFIESIRIINRTITYGHLLQACQIMTVENQDDFCLVYQS